MPGDTTAPVTARDRVAAAIEARVKASVLPERPPYDGSIGLAYFVGAAFHDLADVAMAVLAGDPGDLPARMSALALRWVREIDEGRSDEASTVAAAKEMTAEILSVRREYDAHLAARAEHAEGAAVVNRERGDQFRQERDAAVAAVRTAHIAHIREEHPGCMHDSECSGCRMGVALSRSLPSRPDDPEEIRRLAQATEGEDRS